MDEKVVLVCDVLSMRRCNLKLQLWHHRIHKYNCTFNILSLVMLNLPSAIFKIYCRYVSIYGHAELRLISMVCFQTTDLWIVGNFYTWAEHKQSNSEKVENFILTITFTKWSREIVNLWGNGVLESLSWRHLMLQKYQVFMLLDPWKISLAIWLHF